ncbi:MAG: helix-turn-helix transcriptional regulator [Victivallales bacterium]|nr:helix-turn-helix transcriptional regulator [Victivallales bacterium]
MRKLKPGLTLREAKNSVTIYSPGYERMLHRNRLEDWYDVYPFSSVLWAHQVADNTRHGQWHLTRQNYHQIALELQLENEVIYIQNGQKTVLVPGELFVTRPGDTVIMRNAGTEESRQLQLLISGCNAQIIMDSLQIMAGFKFCFAKEDGDFFRSRLEQFFTLLHQKNPAESWLNSLRCHELLLFLADCINKNQNELKEIPKSVMALLQIMETESGRHSSIEELAKGCGVSIRSIFRLFKQYIGVTPHAYRQRLQVEKAQYLLKNSTDSIKEIAEKLGFPNAFYFSSVFSRSTGVSPSDYRKNHIPATP